MKNTDPRLCALNNCHDPDCDGHAIREPVVTARAFYAAVAVCAAIVAVGYAWAWCCGWRG